MKVYQALQIQHIYDGRAVPSDMMSDDLVYFSEKRQQFIRIVDMDIVHLVRAFNKLYQPNEYDEPVSDETLKQENAELKEKLKEYKMLEDFLNKFAVIKNRNKINER